ncbi:uncharacterized protein LOC133327325 [Musca vetustissima]|uniref:uncharacterized protein LOC133327325 n=1 Tax=Musca vetustissima TaxID=27455 RepID=UPI002AB7E1F6|nr:uncharacterized protein LOC133327325 [Musca vetustissima]
MRKAISLDTKIKILDQLATGQGATVVGNNFGIHEATEIDPDTSSQSKQHAFSASTGWMTGFLKRHALHNIKIKGETASAD